MLCPRAGHAQHINSRPASPSVLRLEIQNQFLKQTSGFARMQFPDRLCESETNLAVWDGLAFGRLHGVT